MWFRQNSNSGDPFRWNLNLGGETPPGFEFFRQFFIPGGPVKRWGVGLVSLHASRAPRGARAEVLTKGAR